MPLTPTVRPGRQRCKGESMIENKQLTGYTKGEWLVDKFICDNEICESGDIIVKTTDGKAVIANAYLVLTRNDHKRIDKIRGEHDLACSNYRKLKSQSQRLTSKLFWLKLCGKWQLPDYPILPSIHEYYPPHSFEISNANAHLIAAAPNLYESLEIIIRKLDNGLPIMDIDRTMARTAIAKANQREERKPLPSEIQLQRDKKFKDYLKAIKHNPHIKWTDNEEENLL